MENSSNIFIYCENDKNMWDDLHVANHITVLYASHIKKNVHFVHGVSQSYTAKLELQGSVLERRIEGKLMAMENSLSQLEDRLLL